MTSTKGPIESRSGWRPILQGSMAERAREVVFEIASALENPPPPLSLLGGPPTSIQLRQFDLAQGKAGFALFYHYAAEALGIARYQELAALNLTDAIESLADTPMGPSLYHGFIGVAWAVEHLRSRDNSSAFSDDPNEQIDEALLELLSVTPWRNHYDLISGLVGFGVYAAERLPRPTAQECARRILGHLCDLATPRPEGLAWLTPPENLPPDTRAKYPQGVYNLGMAHGSPAILAILTLLRERQFEPTQIESILEQAVPWLLTQRMKQHATYRFPSFVMEGTAPAPSRHSWCYGDPGVAAALFQAARTLCRPDWEAIAVDTIEESARHLGELEGIRDAGLCHGAAGLAHLYNRLYQATNRPSLREAACFWLDRALRMRIPDQGVAGFQSVIVDENQHTKRINDPGILMGAAGIGLSFLAAISTSDPSWDRMLLVGVPHI